MRHELVADELRERLPLVPVTDASASQIRAALKRTQDMLAALGLPNGVSKN